MSARSGAPSSTTAPQRLPGFVASRVSELQRTRILDAMARACAELGAANVTVASVVERSGVSRRTFYELFNDRESCLLAAIEDALDRASAPVLDAYRLSGSWREQIRSGLIAFLRFLEEEPYAGHLVVIEALGGGAAALELRRRMLEYVVEAVDRGRANAKAGDASLLTAEAVVGGVLAVLHARLQDDDSGPPVELLGHLMSIVTLPYLGAAAARRELARPLPEPAPRTRPSYAGLLGELRPADMRLTYRTVRVLASIAAHPGASNRELARASDVQDQGQMSKLLTRLERLGLIENGSGARTRGGANAWSLTVMGTEMHRVTSERAIGAASSLAVRS